LDVSSALAVSLGARTSAGLVARQPVQLGVEPARGKLLVAGDFLAALPPVALLRRIGDGLRPGLALVYVRAVSRFLFLP